MKQLWCVAGLFSSFLFTLKAQHSLDSISSTQGMLDTTKSKFFISYGAHALLSSGAGNINQQLSGLLETRKGMRYRLGALIPFRAMKDSCYDRIRWGLFFSVYHPLSKKQRHSKTYLKGCFTQLWGSFYYDGILSPGSCLFRSPFDVAHSNILTAGITRSLYLCPALYLDLDFDLGARYNYGPLEHGKWWPNLNLNVNLNYALSKP